MPLLSERWVTYISAHGSDETIARALEIRAADYIVKQFSPMELNARIQAALCKHAGPPEPLEDGQLFIDYEERSASLEGR